MFNLLNVLNEESTLIADGALASAILGEVHQLGGQMRTGQAFSVTSPTVNLQGKKFTVAVSGTPTEASGTTIPQGNAFADFMAISSLTDELIVDGESLYKAIETGTAGSASLNVGLYGHKYALTIAISPVA